MSRIIRVFPTFTSASPSDEYAFFGEPPFDILIPEADKVMVSCTFTWDRKRAEQLYKAWAHIGLPIEIGGPAYNNQGDEFIPNMFLRSGHTITSRGCVKKCEFCFVPKREGVIRELDIKVGNIIHDNNFLATSEKHQRRVFDMLNDQKNIEFRGGLDIDLVTDTFIRACSWINLKRVFIAYDQQNINKLKRIAEFVNAMRCVEHKPEIMCYALVGFKGDTPEAAHKRCEDVYRTGAMPFAQYYQSDLDRRNYPAGKWQQVVRYWSRPAIYRNHFKRKD